MEITRKENPCVSAAAWGLIALGLLLRLRQYLVNRSLWLDEAMLALNIVHKSVGGLFGKLDDEQGAPLGFLLLEKLAATLFGSGERALRLLPLLGGCASLILFYLLARRMLKAPGLLTALALFAISPSLVYYASEVKQYASDVFFTVLLFYLFTRPSRQGVNLPLIIAGLLAPWFSHPAIFVLTAIGLTLLVENHRRPLPILALGAGWLFSFGVLYLVNLRGLASNEFLRVYWQEYFRLPPHVMLLGLFSNPGGLRAAAPVLLAILLCGAGLLLARRSQIAGSALLVFVFAMSASWMRLYPFAGRMILFILPLVYIFLAAGVELLWNIFPRPRWLSPLLALSLAGFLLYSPALDSAERFLHPKTPEHIRPALAYLSANLKPGDTLYVYYWALPAYRYYANPGVDYVAGGLHSDDPPSALAELDTLRGQRRVWVLFSHVYESGNYNEKNWMLNYLDQIGERKRQFIEPGTSVYLYLYDLR